MQRILNDFNAMTLFARYVSTHTHTQYTDTHTHTVTHTHTRGYTRTCRHYKKASIFATTRGSLKPICAKKRAKPSMNVHMQTHTHTHTHTHALHRFERGQRNRWCVQTNQPMRWNSGKHGVL